MHTRDLPQQNTTSDSTINDISIEQELVVITKDADFVDSFFTIQKPSKLLLVSTGNIRNSELEEIFNNNLSTLVNLLKNMVSLRQIATKLSCINSLVYDWLPDKTLATFL